METDVEEMELKSVRRARCIISMSRAIRHAMRQLFFFHQSLPRDPYVGINAVTFAQQKERFCSYPKLK